MQMKSGSAPYSSACSRTQAIAALDVDDVVGEGRPRAQPVVDVEADPAVAGEVVEQRDALLGATADDPAAAVDLDDRRARLARAGARRQVDVEEQRPVAVARELDPAPVADAARPQHQRRQDAAGCAGSAERALVRGRLELGERLAHRAGAA